ncbi:MAG: hypothetical protein JRH19_17315 [Deltaproteobacteria bacterium]|nr:hypothetical protein [Deltaproteobacteria bacterium]
MVIVLLAGSKIPANAVPAPNTTAEAVRTLNSLRIILIAFLSFLRFSVSLAIFQLTSCLQSPTLGLSLGLSLDLCYFPIGSRRTAATCFDPCSTLPQRSESIQHCARPCVPMARKKFTAGAVNLVPVPRALELQSECQIDLIFTST